MLPLRTTDRTRRVWSNAARQAGVRSWKATTPGDVAMALLEDKEGVAARILDRADVDVSRVQNQLGRGSVDVPSEASARDVLDRACAESRRLGHRWIGTEHLLLAVTSLEATRVARVLAAHGLTHDRVEAAVLTLLKPKPARWHAWARKLGAFCGRLLRSCRRRV